MSKVPIKKILLEDGSERYPLSSRIFNRLQDVPVQMIGPEKLAQGSEKGHKLRMGKDILHLLAFQGEFLKPCPGTKEYICCGYQILNIATNCPLDCSYCILQSYFNHPNLRVFVNLEEQLKQALKITDAHPEEIFRIGTGEFTDSLALDHLVGWSELLLPEFTRRKNIMLELKTKTNNIKKLLDLDIRKRIVVSWTLNSPFITVNEEHRAASLEKRLKAARRCQEEGFVLGFHFDPLVFHSNWQESYLKTVDLLDKYIDPKGIIWISMGSMRFMPKLKEIIKNRHPRTNVLKGEFIRGLDGKMRYFKPLRIQLYTHLRKILEEWYPDLGLYLCMEADDVWQKSMGWSPLDSSGLKGYLDQRVKKKIG